MQLALDDEFRGICRHIVDRNLTIAEWAAIESDDTIRTEHYSGGFDATEEAFCFSYFDSLNREFWFQVTLVEVIDVLKGRMFTFEAVPRPT